jgi:hypothetical protein
MVVVAHNVAGERADCLLRKVIRRQLRKLSLQFVHERSNRYRVAGAQSPSGYISEHTCDPLALLAALFPDRMLSLVMTEVERMSNNPLPVAQRAPRIAALERELDELHRVEESLVAAAMGRSPSAPPAAVLGVRVADTVSRAADARRWRASSGLSQPSSGPDRPLRGCPQERRRARGRAPRRGGRPFTS